MQELEELMALQSGKHKQLDNFQSKNNSPLKNPLDKTSNKSCHLRNTSNASSPLKNTSLKSTLRPDNNEKDESDNALDRMKDEMLYNKLNEFREEFYQELLIDFNQVYSKIDNVYADIKQFIFTNDEL